MDLQCARRAAGCSWRVEHCRRDAPRERERETKHTFIPFPERRDVVSLCSLFFKWWAWRARALHLLYTTNTGPRKKNRAGPVVKQRELPNRRHGEDLF